MGTTNDILNFAVDHKVFSRKELIINLKSQNQLKNPASLSEQLNRLLKSGQLIRLEHGIYTLPDKTKKDFSIVCYEEMKRINQQLKSQFPFATYCIWPGSTLLPYMHHIPSLGFMLVDVEREVAESVFNLLNSDSSKRVYLMPSSADFERYINTNEAIVIRPLTSESPLKLVDDINTPTIEKIMVDIVGDVEFSFLRGVEINYVYNTIFEKHNINKNKLLRYASRRGRKQLVEELIKTNNL
jgi:hypothetical protein